MGTPRGGRRGRRALEGPDARRHAIARIVPHPPPL